MYATLHVVYCGQLTLNITGNSFNMYIGLYQDSLYVNLVSRGNFGQYSCSRIYRCWCTAYNIYTKLQKP